MEFPEDILRIIHAYSKPCTHPQWKTLHRMTLARFQNDLRFTISQLILYKPRTYQNYIRCSLLTETLYR
uniref:Uncharacterized protein n=1 Tax=viral metagenome TaxID=1070528 RepID=A0A6C0AH00_9ZZZZ